MNKENDWKERLGIVYSTNQDFNYQQNEDHKETTLPPEKQNLRIQLSTSAVLLVRLRIYITWRRNSNQNVLQEAPPRMGKL
jgi:hypothetical protein